jgi:anti-anti-sigma factor
MLDVEIVARNGAIICLPNGTLDTTTVATFRGAVAMCLGEQHLIIDLSGVDFVDGAGLTALVGAVRRAREQRTGVVVVAPPGGPRTVLDDAALELIVTIFDTVELALAEIDSKDGRAPRAAPLIADGCRPTA